MWSAKKAIIWIFGASGGRRADVDVLIGLTGALAPSTRPENTSTGTRSCSSRTRISWRRFAYAPSAAKFRRNRSMKARRDGPSVGGHRSRAGIGLESAGGWR